MPTLFILIGAPASGKSTIAAAVHRHVAQSIIIYPDTLRELFPHWPNWLIFREAHRRMDRAFRRGLSVIFDATSTNPVHRRSLITIGRTYQADILAIVLDTPLAVCLERYAHRHPNISQLGLTPAIIERYDRELKQSPPSVTEGFNRVIMINPDTSAPVDEILNLPA